MIQKKNFTQYYILLNSQSNVFWSSINIFLAYYLTLSSYSFPYNIIYWIFLFYTLNLQFYIAIDFLHVITNLILVIIYICQAKLLKYWIKTFHLSRIFYFSSFMTNFIAFCQMGKLLIIHLMYYLLWHT